MILPRTGILSFLNDELREALSAYGEVVPATPSQVIIQEGTDQFYLYVVLRGVFSVATGAGGHAVQLDEILTGESFGEVSIFHPGPASATVSCRAGGELWRLDSDHLQQYLLDNPFAGCALVLGITTLLSRRLKKANALIKANQIVPSFLSVRSRLRGTVTAPAPAPKK